VIVSSSSLFRIPTPHPNRELISWLQQVQYFAQNASSENIICLAKLAEHVPESEVSNSKLQSMIKEIKCLASQKFYDPKLQAQAEQTLQLIYDPKIKSDGLTVQDKIESE
jgi:hypothetical protein